MASVKLEVGKFVTVRRRVDGTSRVLFEVPARLRPSDWSPTLPLPLLAPRTGDLTNADEVARIQADAARLYAEYLSARMGKPPAPKARSVQALVDAWEASQAYKALKPRTQDGYAYFARDVLRWSAAAGHPDPTKLTRNGVERFLAQFDDRPTTRYHMRKVLRLIMDQATALGWRTDNPLQGVKVAMPKSTVIIWEAEDVERLAWAAAVFGQPDLAAMILVEWEIGQRLTDMVLMRRTIREEQEGYFAAQGVFRFYQSKTRSYVTVPVSDRSRALLAKIQREGSPYLFHDGATGRPFRDVNRLGHVFEDVRRGAAGRYVVLRAIRHSCVVQLARCGCTVPEIASITGHSVSTVEAILSTYLPRDNRVAWNAQAKRGLVAAASS